MNRLLVTALRVTLGLSATSTALAQVSTAPAAADAGQLQEILVTAERREENLQRTPVSVSVISGESLLEDGVLQIDQTLQGVPNVYLQGGARGFIIAIRGVGFNAPVGTSESPVSFNSDGAYDSSPESGKTGLFDIARVEVLRGPQGTLYGRNATAGVVNVISNNPVQEFQGSGTVGLGNFGLRSMQGMINVPLSDKFAVRAAFTSINRDGYLSNGTNDNVSQAMRLKAKFTPNESTSVLLGAELTKLGGKDNGTVPGFAKKPDIKWYNPDPGNVYNKASARKFWADIKVDLKFATLSLTPSYKNLQDENYYYFLGQLAQAHQPANFDQISTELRLNSPDSSRVVWDAGLYWYDSKRAEDTVNPSIVGALPTSLKNHYASYAVFGEVTVPVTDSIRLTGGLRKTNDTKKQNENNAGTLVDYGGVTHHWDSLDYKARVEMDVGSKSLLYVQGSSGYRPGGFAFGQSFENEHLRSYEVGSKNRFFDDRLQVNGAIFYYDYRDYQATIAHFDSAGNFLGVTIVNTPPTKVKGAEIEITYAPTAQDLITLAPAFLSARYGSGLLANSTQTLADAFGGNVMPEAPDFAVDASYEHTWTTARGASFAARGEVHYESKSYVFPVQNPQSLQDAYTRSDLYLTYNSPDSKWSASAYVRNLEDEQVKTASFGPGNLVAAPRTFGFNITAKF
jgi:iron complex outermembrane recepter protein